MYLLLPFLIFVVVLLVLFAYWLMWKWYQCGKENEIQSFREGYITKEDCRSMIIIHQVLIVVLTFAMTVAFAFIVCYAFNLSCALIGHLMLGLILFALLCFIIKYPLFLLFGVSLFPFGSNHHPYWRHRIRQM